MRLIKYFIQFIFIIFMFLLFKIIGLKLSKSLSSFIFKLIGPYLRSKKISHSNLAIAFPELNEKESPRLKWGSKILNKMGIKNILTNKSIKIYGNPNLEIKNKIVIKNFLKDHRVFMTSTIAALIFGGNWSIANKDAINTSFPSFLKKIKYLGAKIH